MCIEMGNENNKTRPADQLPFNNGLCTWIPLTAKFPIG